MPADDLAGLWSALDCAVFRRVGPDAFVPLTEVPAWAAPLLTAQDEAGAFRLGAASYFLEHFLAEAEEFWAAGADGSLASCAWSEPVLREAQGQVQATAAQRGAQRFLVLAPAGEVFAEHRAILQQARQGQLEHEALIKEVEKKEVLVHCIVHDLANPLSGIAGTLELLQHTPLAAPAARMVAMALEACERQQTMIRQILDVFSAETHALEAPNLDPQQAPDLRTSAEASLEAMAVSYQRRGVGARVAAEAAEEWHVTGEKTRLERVFGNLLENALRHSPPGSEVVVHLSQSDGFAEAAIEDAGPGAPEEAIPQLFKKLASGRGGVRGKAGLGLYFCRITVERWGGEIGYRREARGGACFWFRLPLRACSR